MGILLFMCFFVIIETIIFAIQDYKSPKIELNKSNWQCTSTYQVRQFNGKFWYTTTECSQYSLRDSK